MKEKNEVKRSREAYLLAVRTKELEAARERLAAMEEVTKLGNALLAVALLAVLGEVEMKREGEALLLPKETVRQALGEYSFMTGDEGEAYRITLLKNETKKEGEQE